MKLIARVKLNASPEQGPLLLQTMEAANALCDWISQQAWEGNKFRRYDIHNAIYHTARQESNLAAQVIVRCIAKVADSYQKDRDTLRTFKPQGAMAYDDRILSWETDNQMVSIWTVKGRERIGYAVTDYHQELLRYRQGETDLIYRKGVFYLLAVCEIPDPDERDVATALGVDLGVVNIAADSDGNTHTSEPIERSRAKQQRLRNQLQKRQTDSARRKLKQLAGKQARFQRDTNHVISKRLIAKAERTNRAIALEDLTGIRERTRVKGKAQRARRSNWSFAQLRDFVTYKAKRAGIPVKLVDPAYTSQRCAACGHLERANRKSQSEFLCCACGHSAHADVNAAKNIAWAAFNQPIVGMSGVSALDLQATGLVPVVS
jgi:IS605 OrfB family transposase